jgi:medium-chain acyl-[acyl-carrier-protein] hydrolase
MTGDCASKWVRFRRDNPHAEYRLFCFPFAGGGASVYREWAASLSPAIDVWPIQLPGREERLGEPAFTQAATLCDALTTVLRPLLDRRFALFGHSMGALITYQLARTFEALGHAPAHLFVSGQKAPHLPLGRPISYNLPERAFHARLRELDGTPEAVLQDPEMMAILSPLLRSDFELSETFPRQHRPPLACAITAFGGTEDAEVARTELDAWRHETRAAFDLRMFVGGHFFLQRAAGDIMQEIARHLNAGRASVRPS